MIRDVLVIESALEHGYSEEDVHCAWCNNLDDARHMERNNVHVRVGIDTHGRVIEMLGEWDERRQTWVVFHAMAPRIGLLNMFGKNGGRNANGKGTRRANRHGRA